jgi:ATP-binding cassette subfamily B protein
VSGPGAPHGFGFGTDDDRVGRAYDHRLMMRLMRYLRPCAGRVVLATVLLILVSLTSLAGPLITRIGIDRYIAQRDFPGLVRICLLWFGLLLVSAVIEFVQGIQMNLIGQRAMLQLRAEIYRHLQRVPIAFYDRHPVGRLMTRLTNDVEVLNQMFTQGVVAIFGDVFTLIGITVVLLMLNWRLALVSFAIVPFIVLVSVQFRRRVRRAFHDIRVALAKINAYLQESLSGVAVIQALRREDRNHEEFAALNAEQRSAHLRSVRAFAVYFPLVELIWSVSLALVLWAGGGRVLHGALTFGALVAFIQYVERFFRPIRDISDKYNILQDAMVSSERIFMLLDEPVESGAVAADGSNAAPAFAPRGTIRFDDVHFSYDGRTPVLSGLACEMPAGSTTAIVGATGSGKTTMASLLTRFYDPTGGRITIGGTDITTVPRRELRRAMAVVEQDVFLFSGMVEENIRLWAPGIAPERLARAIDASHADHLIRRLPDGLRSPVAERGASFSTGERQLIAFARALAFDPEILILDEATASIDSETEALIQDALRVLLENRTAIVIAHRLSTVRRADRILVLHHGRIAEHGRHDELLAAGGIYARLYRLQLQGERGA